MRIIIAVLVVTVLAGCGTSPKTNYFELRETSTSAHAKISLPYAVQVAAVHVPASLDRREMVLDSGTNAVSISGENRWAAPLGVMARRVLSEDLQNHLPAGTVIEPRAPSPPHTAQIVVALSRFGTDRNSVPVLAGSWTMLEGTPHAPVIHREVALHGTSAVDSAAAQAAAMSRLLGRLAGHISAALAAHHEGATNGGT